jgi:hypothetical protein
MKGNYSDLKGSNEVFTKKEIFKYKYYKPVDKAIYSDAKESYLLVDGSYWIWFWANPKVVKKGAATLAKRISECLGVETKYNGREYLGTWSIETTETYISMEELALMYAVLVTFSAKENADGGG